MTTGTDTSRCCLCHKTYRGRSVPRWAFNRDAQPLGTAHTTCLRRESSGRWPRVFPDVIDARLVTCNLARRYVWMHHIRQHAHWTWSTSYIQELLLSDPATHDERCAHWLDYRAVNAREIAIIRKKYAALLAEYEQWSGGEDEA